jgi:hypothetical protein
MKIGMIASCAALSIGLSGCASIVEGTHQDIYVNATPENMSCVASRQGHPIGHYDPASKILSVSKSRDDMVLSCQAPNYKPKTMTFVSSASAWGVAGALTLDLGIIDYTSGALNKYDATITVVLEQDLAAQAASLRSSANGSQVANVPTAGKPCTQAERSQIRIARMNGYTTIPNCDL